MESMIQETSNDISNNDQSKYLEDKQGLQVYLFLVHWLFEAMQLPSRDKKGVQWETIGKESSRSRALDCFSGFLSLNLNSIFVGKSELDFCISEFCQFNLV